MTRRIIYILLAVVVVLVVVLGIRWWLNRGADGDTVTEETAGVVEDMAVESETGETAVTGDASTGDASTGDASTGDDTDQTAVTEGGDSGEMEVVVGEVVEGDQTAAEGSGSTDATSPDNSGQTAVTDSTLGGVAESGDANAGGGIVTPGPADTAAGAVGTGGEAAVQLPASVVVPGQAVQHIVVKNEWLTQLARCYGTTVHDIQAANNFIYPDLIQPGWVVNITNPGNAGPITINEMPCFAYYTVQQGDNLYRIAEQHGIHFQWLARINAIYNYDLIYTGQVLVIPNPVPSELTTAPLQPFYYPSCGYYGCWQPLPAPYGG
ncbi:MAG: LysM peptidoglycan-binding domain-containing protein [Chloroflexi bacterium]|nr:LysM peptidoglycan-binding domain-containing protein [Chloroflexota bacterium]